MPQRMIVLLIMIVTTVGFASVFIIFPDLFNLVSEWVSMVFLSFGLGFSNLFRSILDWIGFILNQLSSIINWFTIPILKLLSLFGIDASKEVAALLLLGLIAFIAFLAIKFTHSSFTKIGFRNIPRRKLRNALTVISIILGVALFVGVNIAFDSVYAQFKDTVIQATGSVDITVRSVLDTPFDGDVLTKVREIDGVANASARVYFTAAVSKPGSEWEMANIIGINSRTDFDYLESVNITRKLHFITPHVYLRVNSKEAVVDERLDYDIGDVFQLYVITEQLDHVESPNQIKFFSLTVVGIHHPPQASTGNNIYMDIVTAQNIMDYEGKIDSIIVKISEIEWTDRIVSDINSKLNQTFVVNPIKKNLLNTMKEATSGLEFGLKVMSALALCVAVVIVLNTVYMNVGERTREVGILRSTGASTKQVFWVFFSEIVTLGIFGAVIGSVAGILMTGIFSYITSILFQSFTSELAFTQLTVSQVQHLVFGAVAGLVTAIIGGLFPSLTACRIDVIKALRPTMRKPGKQRTALKLMAIGLPLTILGVSIYMAGILEEVEVGMFIASLLAPITTIGVIFTMAGLLRSTNPIIEHALFLFGSIRKIISRNIDRNLVRSTACFALIGISLSFIVVMGGAQSGIVMGIEDIIRSFAISDLITISETRVSRLFAQNITNIDDNTLISHTTPALVIPKKTMLVNNISSTKASAAIIAIDPITYPKVISMTFSENTPLDVFTKLNTAGKMILTAPLALSLNVTVGDVVQASIEKDSKVTWINFTIVGLAEGAWLQMMSFDGFSLSETGYISYESNNKFFPEFKDESNLFFVKVKSNQDVDHIKNRIIELYGSKYQLVVATYNEILKQVRTGIDKIFNIFNAIVMYAVVNSIIGLTSIMIMNVATRRREIGILRSQGVSNAQVVKSIFGEGVTLGIVGFTTGTILGLIFHRITVSYMHLTGFTMPYIIPFDSIGLSLILAILTSLLSAVYPAYRASRLNIVDSLRS